MKNHRLLLINLTQNPKVHYHVFPIFHLKKLTANSQLDKCTKQRKSVPVQNFILTKLHFRSKNQLQLIG